MPQAGRTTGPNLDIHIDNIGRPYQPGDIITGRVVRRTHVVSPEASVTIQLLGRAKTKLVVTRNAGNSTTYSYYRSRFNFVWLNRPLHPLHMSPSPHASAHGAEFDAGYMHTKQRLHKGPIHVPSSNSPVAWEFAIEIPTRPSPRTVGSATRNPDASYLPLDAASIAEHPLPSSFTTSGSRGNTRFEAYVEYHLEATLTQQRHSSSGSNNLTASLPLHIRAPPPTLAAAAAADFGLERRSAQLAATSYRLVPGMEDAELTFRQKSRKFFGSAKVPAFGFTLQYDCPSVIQLDSPVPIPLRVRIVPDGRRTSEVLQGVPQVVVLVSLEMVLKADTFVIAPGHFGSHTGEGTVKHHIVLPVASAGSVPASVLGGVGREGDGDEPAGKEVAHQGAVHRPGSGDVKRSVEPPRDEQGESSSSQAARQPVQFPEKENPPAEESSAAAIAAPETHNEPPAVGESSSPPTYQPRADDDPPPPHTSAPESSPPKAAPATAASAAAPQTEQPPAYQPAAPRRHPHSPGPLVIPSAWDTTGNNDGPWVDVGAALGLRLHETQATCRGQTVARMVAAAGTEPLSPGFTTYCIRHSHRVKWKICVGVGGGRIGVEWERGVGVVGAAGGG
ncbi:hypothetical protein DHEL01_v205711 [Diaporthe helianthi]|uniref:Arrestin-like N-terminal domain-containing protein n=1 Tax=Diaporthe helianthi TaxID=158607 RepID=A0A2P5I043_DIAHE|nr:hypothetical protein DHEL01_v205711 [Diaporthe helianthi]